MADLDSTIENYINRVLESTPSLQDLLELQALHARGVHPKTIARGMESRGTLADLLDMQASGARGLRAKLLRRILEQGGTLEDVLALHASTARGLRSKTPSREMDVEGAFPSLSAAGLREKRPSREMDVDGMFPPLSAQGLREKRPSRGIEVEWGLPALATPGLRSRDPRRVIEREGSLADLLDLHGAHARGLRARNPSRVVEPLILIPDLLDQMAGAGRLTTQSPTGQLHTVEFPFNGAWVPDEDALKIGLHNFASLQNMRYTNDGLEGVAGYSRITTTPMVSTPIGGIQLLRTVAGLTQSVVLVQAGVDIYQHTAVIPAAADFGSSIATVTAGGTATRFSHAPNAHILYANGVDTMIWGGGYRPVQAFINFDEANTFAHDFTLQLNNTLTDAAHRVTLVRDVAGPDIWLHIGSTRPLQGIGFTVSTANTSASTSAIGSWNGSAWAGVGGFADGTASGGITLAQTGNMTFTPDPAARVRFLYERLLYWYRVNIGATGTPDATIVLSYCSTDAPMQSVVDIWDGVERSPIWAGAVTRDYTLEILTPSSSATPIGADLYPGGGVFFLLGFEARQTALRIHMCADFPNTTVSTLAVSYWNGSTFTSVGTITDGTSAGGITFTRNGDITWNAPAGTTERVYVPSATFGTSSGGRTCYLYQLSFSVALDNIFHKVLVDTVTGIPAQRWNYLDPILPCVFPFHFAGRAMLVGFRGENERHRIEYSAVFQPDVWNGEQSSDHGKAIYIGAGGALTAGISLSNRYYGTQREIAVLLKSSETWVLEGASPDTFAIYQVSDVVGCPAVYSLTRAEIPVMVEQQALRNVAMWCSAKGPVMFDGATVLPMRFPQPDGAISSVDAYFNPADSRAVNTASWDTVVGWYDSTWGEYNLTLPSGSGQTVPNTWLVCDLRRRKWYRKIPTTSYPTAAIAVQDVSGNPYSYATINTGHLLRLENGLTWDGVDIAHLVDTVDTPLLGEQSPSIWDESLVRYGTAIVVAEAGATATLTCAHSPNGTETFTTWQTVTLLKETARWNRKTVGINLRAKTHQFRFSSTTNGTQRAPRLLGHAYLYRNERRLYPPSGLALIYTETWET